MNALAARRRHPAAIAILLFLGLALVGTAYSLLAPKPAQAAVATADDAELGKQLFLANCATCHGVNAEGTKSGPTLMGVGAASVDFQVGTGRMPLAGPNVQAPRIDEVKFTEEQIAAMAAYVASLAPGPAIPDAKLTSGEGGDVARRDRHPEVVRCEHRDHGKGDLGPDPGGGLGELEAVALGCVREAVEGQRVLPNHQRSVYGRRLARP